MSDEEKKIDIGAGREVILKPELAERPALGPAIAEVRLKAPWWPGKSRRKIIALIDGLVAAFRLRARGEPEVTISGKGDRVVVRRRRENGSDEIRLARESRTRATLYCDRRELENLYALGVLARAKVVSRLESPGNKG